MRWVLYILCNAQEDVMKKNRARNRDVVAVFVCGENEKMSCNLKN
jgi:hypothetical protein